ncbi:AI-2E family transporter [Sphingobacterium griseoflavum]|uniref:Permease n=1 Tax=Sphingobacterium griseoflavum TaxID=1474952 RepID=A0ABQ3HTZ0_9SPHI|nr:AI-2E family transporter [Sphingobacterium griseoflavum]GHE34012.1 hypothetical protein GCM10017764_16640 [Sphingobacterium griseoflavum]
MTKKASLVGFNQFLYFLIALFGIMYLGRSFLIPLAIGCLFAMLLIPACRWLERRKFSRFAAAAACVFSLVLVLIGVLTLLTQQIVSLNNDLSNLHEHFYGFASSVQDQVEETFGIAKDEQKAYLADQMDKVAEVVGSYAAFFVAQFGSFLVHLVIIITYTLLLLVYRGRIKNFVLKLVEKHTGQGQSDHTRKVVHEVANVSNAYVAGVFYVVAILSVCNTVALYAIGVEHAVLFGILAGLLNIIPYLGSLVGSLIPVIYVLLTKDAFSYAIIVGGYFLLIQQVESYVLTPNITGGKIKLSPLFTILIVLFGNLIWGIAGMVLFVPLLGIAKVIFDHVPQLEPYGYLIAKK